MIFVNEYEKIFDPLSENYEPVEIQVINKFLDKEASVLELGGRLGVVSNFINQKITNKKAHIVIEPYASYAKILEKNKELNKSEYTVLNGAISEFPLFYDSEKTNKQGRDNTVPCSYQNSNVTQLTYLEAQMLLPKNNNCFTHLVVDCEGSFERFLKENFQYIKTWKWIFLEADCTDICDYSFINRTLLYFGFKIQQVSSIHYIYYK
jgi:FkbM family methyltransferase